MNRTAFLVLGLALLGAEPAPAALTAGTVRDQHGAPVRSARVVLYADGKEVAVATTGADGTFAAPGIRADGVEVGCEYCAPLRESVPSDGIVVAIVRRYDALAGRAPAPDDVTHVPYARIESVLALAPFVVLNESPRLSPGPQLSDRRLPDAGGLFVLNGVPDYDVAANVSPYLTIPDRDFTNVDVRTSADAYLYGDTANQGIFSVGTHGGASAALAGSGGTLRIAQNGAQVNGSAGYSNAGDGEQRARADADMPFDLPGALGEASFGMGELSALPAAGAPLASEFSSARVSLQRTSGVDLSGSIAADRGTYAYDSVAHPAYGTWSDVDARALVRSHATVAPFVLAEARRSTAHSTLGQVRGALGLTINGPAWNVLAELGSDAVSYASSAGIAGARETTHDALLSATWMPSAHLNVEGSASNGYLLPTFDTAYGSQTPYRSFADRTGTFETTVTLGDARRLRFSLTALRSADDAESTGSAGASLAWQISPRISLRTWLLRVSDSARGTASVGSTWLTYDTGAFRIDAIARRDLRGLQPDAHVDASLSGRIVRSLWWFAGSERRDGRRTFDAGLRW